MITLVLIGWIPISIALFAVMPARRALMITFLGGWLFLPVGGFSMAGLPDFTKAVAVSLGSLLGLMLFGSQHLADLRPRWLDLPMLVWCLVPAASSLANDKGGYDAVAVTLSRGFEWGIPYLLGRALFRSFAALDYLARCLFIGGLIYAPFCLYEVRMSPQLHAKVYGYAQHSFVQHIRLEGYRPLVFMEHGLMVALWMTIATLAGFALWRWGGMRWLLWNRARWLLLGLLLTTVLCKSMGALVLLGIGLAALAGMRLLRTRLPIYLLMAGPLLFVGARLGLDWQAVDLIAWIETFAPDRASSLWFRIGSEQVFMPGIWQRPWLGWSSWGFDPSSWEFNPAFDEDGLQTRAARDSYWLNITVCYGVIGLVAFFGMCFAPILGLLRRLPARDWLEPRIAATGALVVAICLYVCDSMFNAMINPVYTVVLGGLAAVAAGEEAVRVPASLDSALVFVDPSASPEGST